MLCHIAAANSHVRHPRSDRSKSHPLCGRLISIQSENGIAFFALLFQSTLELAY
jgi:hypothetical protein